MYFSMQFQPRLKLKPKFSGRNGGSRKRYWESTQSRVASSYPADYYYTLFCLLWSEPTSQLCGAGLCGRQMPPVSLCVVYAHETTEQPLISALTDSLLRRLYEQKFPSFNLNPFIPNKLGAPTGGTLVYNGGV